MNTQNHDELIAALSSFKERDKFPEVAWEERGLNPSDDDVCEQLNNIFENCADKLIAALQNDASQEDLKIILITELNATEELMFDTEEREFVVDLFHELGEMLNIDIKKDLMKWLYGPAFPFGKNE